LAAVAALGSAGRAADATSGRGVEVLCCPVPARPDDVAATCVM
jgi:hypothetical protein